MTLTKSTIFWYFFFYIGVPLLYVWPLLGSREIEQESANHIVTCVGCHILGYLMGSVATANMFIKEKENPGE